MYSLVHFLIFLKTWQHRFPSIYSDQKKTLLWLCVLFYKFCNLHVLMRLSFENHWSIFKQLWFVFACLRPVKKPYSNFFRDFTRIYFQGSIGTGPVGSRNTLYTCNRCDSTSLYLLLWSLLSYKPHSVAWAEFLKAVASHPEFRHFLTCVVRSSRLRDESFIFVERYIRCHMSIIKPISPFKQFLFFCSHLFPKAMDLLVSFFGVWRDCPLPCPKHIINSWINKETSRILYRYQRLCTQRNLLEHSAEIIKKVDSSRGGSNDLTLALLQTSALSLFQRFKNILPFRYVAKFVFFSFKKTGSTFHSTRSLSLLT